MTAPEMRASALAGLNDVADVMRGLGVDIVGGIGPQHRHRIDLAEQFSMTLTGMRKHVGILEEAGLVTTKKVGRVRYCRVGARRLDEVATWIETYHQLWDARFRELDDVLEALQRKEQQDGRRHE